MDILFNECFWFGLFSGVIIMQVASAAKKYLIVEGYNG